MKNRSNLRIGGGVESGCGGDESWRWRTAIERKVVAVKVRRRREMGWKKGSNTL